MSQEIDKLSSDELMMVVKKLDSRGFENLRVSCRTRPRFEEFLKNMDHQLENFEIDIVKNRLIEVLYGRSNRHAVIFDYDDRRELKDVSIGLKSNAKKAAALIHKSLLIPHYEGGYKLQPTSRMIYSRRGRKLCPMEKFYNQPEAAFCTSIIIHERVAIMPKHCNRNFYPDQMRLVFGFWNDQNSDPLMIDSNNVLEIEEVVDDDKEDLSFLILKGAANAVHIQTRFGVPQKNQNVYLAGYPGTETNHNRIPLKVVDNAKVQSLSGTRFTADLDVFRGNSGSPVFNGDELIGMFISVFSDHFASFNKECDISCYCDHGDRCHFATCLSMKYIATKLTEVLKKKL